MKKIAFLSFDWNNEVVSQYINGMERFMKDHENVLLHVFDGFGNFGTNEVQKGSLQIFNLPYLKTYDGVIIEGNRAWKPEDRQMIADRAIANGLPVVSINYPLKGCTNVYSDNEESEYQIVNHVITEHGVRRLAFVRGLNTSLETEDREKGFLRAVADHDISQYRILDGSWDQAAGKNAVDTLMASGLMPEAIICSNDDAAYGAIEELKKYQYRIPENIIVTGFDNLNLAEASDPRITTVSRNYAGIAYAAMDLILINQEKNAGSQEDMKITGELIRGSSCGCGDYHREIQDIKKKYVNVNLKVKHFYRVYDDIQTMLDHAESLSEIGDIIEKKTRILTGGNVWMVINGDYLDRYANTPAVRHYGDHMYLYAISDGGKHVHDERHVYETFSRRQILPDAYLAGDRMLEIYPLHYDEIAIGYVVMDGMPRKEEMNFLEVLFALLESAIENIHNKYVQASLNDQLTTMYITDQQTGLYNRFGMKRYAETYYHEKMKKRESVFVTFFDIDTVGKAKTEPDHIEEGKMVGMMADVLKKTFQDRDGVAVRYGTNEFVVFSDQNVKDTIMEEIRKTMHSEKGKQRYRISAGVYEAKNEDCLTFQEAINCADDAMYETKKSFNHR